MRLLTALGIGAGAMYFFDPQLGNRRRALVRDKFTRLIHEFQDAVDVVQRDLNNRIHGFGAMIDSALHREAVSDDVLHERVRSKLGRVSSHPGAIEVSVSDGQVTLRGPILSTEVQQTFNAVRGVPGVKRVINELEVHEHADISALQGGRPRPGARPEILQENWSPTTRLMVGALGTGLVLYGSLRRAPVACFLGTAGLALLARSATNISAAQAWHRAHGEGAAEEVASLRRQPSAIQRRKQDTASSLESEPITPSI
jgi:hypothetical protein